MTYTKGYLQSLLSKKLLPETKVTIEKMIAECREPEDLLADHESALVEMLIQRSGSLELARTKLETLLDRMRENGFENPNVREDYRDFRLAQSALDDLKIH